MEQGSPPGEVRSSEGLGGCSPKRDLASMSTDELRAEIARLQSELVRRVCGDPVKGIGLSIGGRRL